MSNDKPYNVEMIYTRRYDKYTSANSNDVVYRYHGVKKGYNDYAISYTGGSIELGNVARGVSIKDGILYIEY